MVKQKLCAYVKVLAYAAISLVVAVPVHALSPSQEEQFAQNDIMFYDPEGDDPCFTGNGTVSIQGSAAAEKVWSGMRSIGFTEEQTAGIMGNMQHESNFFNPAQHEDALMADYWKTSKAADRNSDGTFNLGANKAPEGENYHISYGLGLIQWSFGRRANLYKYISENDPALLQYFNNPEQYSTEGYKVSGDKFIEIAGQEAADALYSWEIQYLWEEMGGNRYYGEVLLESTVEGAAYKFLKNVEVPNGFDGGETLAEAKSMRPERFTDAQKYYDAFAGTTIQSGGGSSVAQDGSDVTVIGDSLTERAQEEILGKFSGMTEAQVDSVQDRMFDEGIDILGNTDLKNTVVFALGTNSAGVTQEQVDEVLTTVGATRKLVFLTNHGNYDYTSNNALFQKAAQEHSNVVIADWAGSVAADPSRFVVDDNVHQTPEGEQLFADLIYDAINKNVTQSGCGPGGDLTSTVLAYAWPEYHSKPFLERMPAYAEAVKRQQDEGLYVGGSVRGVPGIDCGGFVTILMQDSGYEPLYNTGPNGTGAAGNVSGGQEDWVVEHGWTLVNDSNTTRIDTSLLQHGDVAFSGGVGPGEGGHTFVYVGEIPGFNSVIASASYSDDGTGGRAPMAGGEDLEWDDYRGGIVRWYRKGN